MVKISQVNRDNYIVIQGWMVTELGLKGNDLLVYAIIYGFSQVKGQKFTGSLQYLADWTNSTKRGILKNLQKLIDRGLIYKQEKIYNGIKNVEYGTKFTSGEQSSSEVVNKVHQGSEQSSPNNIDNNIEDNIYTTTIINSDDIFEFIEKNFMRTLSPIELEKIKEWEDNELTRYVISKAVLNQKYNINYIDKVLYEMKQKGIFTVQQAQQSDEEYRKSKQKPKTTFIRYKTAYDREQEAIAKFLSDENE